MWTELSCFFLAQNPWPKAIPTECHRPSPQCPPRENLGKDPWSTPQSTHEPLAQPAFMLHPRRRCPSAVSHFSVPLAQSAPTHPLLPCLPPIVLTIQVLGWGLSKRICECAFEPEHYVDGVCGRKISLSFQACPRCSPRSSDHNAWRPRLSLLCILSEPCLSSNLHDWLGDATRPGHLRGCCGRDHPPNSKKSRSPAAHRKNRALRRLPASTATPAEAVHFTADGPIASCNIGHQYKLDEWSWGLLHHEHTVRQRRTSTVHAMPQHMQTIPSPAMRTKTRM